VIRHAKRSIARKPATGRATGNLGRLSAALIAALCAALLISAGASAAGPEFKTTFSCAEDAAGAPQSCGGTTEWRPGRIALNEATGDVYVMDTEPAAGAIRIFDEDGNYKSTIDGENAPGESFSFGGSTGFSDIAIDNSFDVNGDPTATQGRIYLASNLGSYFGIDATGTSFWKEEVSLACGVGVDTKGNFYTATYTGDVQERNPTTGAPEGGPIVTSADFSDPCKMAFDSSDNLFLQHIEAETIAKLDAPGYATPGTLLPDIFQTDVEVDRSRDRTYTIGGTLQLHWFESDGSQPAGSPVNSGDKGRTYRGLGVNSNTGRLYIGDEGNKQVEIWDPPLLKLEVFPTGSGTGTVECDLGSGPEACLAEYPEGTEVELIATPDAGSQFVGFDGSSGSASACSASPCQITMDANTQVFAEFALIHKLTVKKAGTGSGSVTCDSGSGSGPCAAEYEEGTEVTLEASADSGSTFSGWSGENCSGAGACKVKMTVARTVTATFTADPIDGGDPPQPPIEPKPPVIDPPPPVDKLGPCIAAANKAAQKAKKAARKKKGKAKAKAIKAANKRKAKAKRRCKARFA
jgi:hypothetical protein